MSLLIDFQPEHIPLIGDPTPIAVAHHLAEHSQASLSLIKDDKYLAAFGLYALHPTAAQAWMLVNPDYRHTYAKTILRHAQEELERWQISEGFNRVQITIEFVNAGFVRWSKLLGFEMEGLMRCYGQDGQDHFLMARIR
jgi:hypothetical protein